MLKVSIFTGAILNSLVDLDLHPSCTLFGCLLKLQFDVLDIHYLHQIDYVCSIDHPFTFRKDSTRDGFNARIYQDS